ncbi:MAG: diguanylate cyclase [Rhodospirillales bacterium]
MADMTSSDGPLPVPGIGQAAGHGSGRQGASEGTDSYGRNVVAEERRQRSMADFRDFISMLDVPAEELTPAVRDAFQKVFAELLQREEKVDELTGRVNWLNTLTDAHPFLPVMNRRAFIGKLARVLDVVRHSGGSNSLVYVEATGVGHVRRQFGHKVEEAALNHISDQLTEPLTPADIIGNLGGYAFGVVIFGSGLSGAADYLSHVKAAIAGRPFTHEGQTLSLGVDAGVTMIGASDSAQSLLDAADKNRNSGDNIRE